MQVNFPQKRFGDALIARWSWMFDLQAHGTCKSYKIQTVGESMVILFFLWGKIILENHWYREWLHQIWLFDGRHTCPPPHPGQPKKDIPRLACFFCASATAQTIDATIFILVTTKAGNKSGNLRCRWQMFVRNSNSKALLTWNSSFLRNLFLLRYCAFNPKCSPKCSPKHATGQADIFSSKSIEKKCHA